METVKVNPAKFAIQLFFRQDDAGWSERYVTTATDYTGGTALLNQLLPIRLAMLPGSVRITYSRLSDLSVPGDSVVIVPADGGGNYGLLVGGHLKAEDPWDALLVNLRATPFYRSRMFLRGLPDIADEEGTLFTPDTAWAGAFTSWASWIKGNCGMISYRGVVPDAGGFLHGIFNPITSVEWVRLTSRRVGRPFGLPVGRRRV